MIVAAPTLIVPRKQWGWTRPVPVEARMGNYRLPNGVPGFVNGIVSTVPAGTDIYPVSEPDGEDVLDFNCVQVGVYVPPTRISFSYLFGYNVNPGQDRDYVLQSVTHDMVLKDFAGSNLFPAVGGYPSSVDTQNGFYTNFGTNFSVLHSIGEGAGVKTMTLTVSSQRGAVLQLVTYEEGGDGVVTPSIQGRGLVPYAVNAYRQSDNTYQTVANCGVNIPPGVCVVRIWITWASGNPLAGQLAFFTLSPEIPYGL